MAFALWIDSDTAWAAGTHEYRPMGVAVIASSDVFRVKDFAPGRRPPAGDSAAFHGLFPSLGELNAYLGRQRSLRKQKRNDIPLPPWLL
jgi:hypothetical protein